MAQRQPRRRLAHTARPKAKRSVNGQRYFRATVSSHFAAIAGATLYKSPDTNVAHAINPRPRTRGGGHPGPATAVTGGCDRRVRARDLATHQTSPGGSETSPSGHSTSGRRGPDSVRQTRSARLIESGPAQGMTLRSDQIR